MQRLTQVRAVEECRTVLQPENGGSQPRMMDTVCQTSWTGSSKDKQAGGTEKLKGKPGGTEELKGQAGGTEELKGQAGGTEKPKGQAGETEKPK